MMYSICFLKNITNGIIIINGVSISPQESYQIQNSERLEFGHNSDIDLLIINQSLEVHNDCGIVGTIEDQIDWLKNPISNKTYVWNLPPFTSKKTEDGYNLFRRKNGESITVDANSNQELLFVVPYSRCKINKVEVLGASLGDFADLKVYDDDLGTISDTPNLFLNQFGNTVYLRPEFYSDESQYDADLIKNMIIGVNIHNSTNEQKTYYVNFTLHELK